MFPLNYTQFEADVLGCNVYSDGNVTAIDTWNPLSPRWNSRDDDQVGYPPKTICSYNTLHKKLINICNCPHSC